MLLFCWDHRRCRHCGRLSCHQLSCFLTQSAEMAPEMHAEIAAWLFWQTVLDADQPSSFDSQEALASEPAAQSETE